MVVNNNFDQKAHEFLQCSTGDLQHVQSRTGTIYRDGGRDRSETYLDTLSGRQCTVWYNHPDGEYKVELD